MSLGTGRLEGLGKTGTTSTSLKTKLNHVISSATDTEGECEDEGSSAPLGSCVSAEVAVAVSGTLRFPN